MNNEQVVCPNCGHINSITSMFCASCGASLKDVIAAKKAEIAANALPKEEVDYQKASELMKNGLFDKAEAIFSSLGEYKDAADKAKFAQQTIKDRAEMQAKMTYQNAVSAFSNGDLAKAEELFTKLGGYADSNEKLVLVKKAQEATLAQQTEQKYKNGLNLANQAQTSSEIISTIQLFESLGDYKNSKQIIATLTEQYNTQVEVENKQKAARNKKIKIITAVIALVVVVVGSAFFYVTYTKNQADQLVKSVKVQRQKNQGSFDKLDSDSKQNIKEMMKSFDANQLDYTYSVKSKTDDMAIIEYTFVSPDKTKDKLPKDRTLMNESTAMFRK